MGEDNETVLLVVCELLTFATGFQISFCMGCFGP